TESFEAPSRGPSSLPAPGNIPSRGGPSPQGFLSGPIGNALTLGPTPFATGQPGGRGIGIGSDFVAQGPGGPGANLPTGGPSQRSPTGEAQQPGVMERIANFLQNFNPISPAEARGARGARGRGQGRGPTTRGTGRQSQALGGPRGPGAGESRGTLNPTPAERA